VVRVVPYKEDATQAAGRKLRGSVRRYERPLEPVGDWHWDALQ